MITGTRTKAHLPLGQGVAMAMPGEAQTLCIDAGRRPSENETGGRECRPAVVGVGPRL
jgi:hypothetical protein